MSTNFQLVVQYMSENTTKQRHQLSSTLLHVLHRKIITYQIIAQNWDRGGTTVKVLCYKSEGRWFDSSWCHWNFALTKFFRLHYDPGIDSASNRSEYQEHFLGIKMAGA